MGFLDTTFLGVRYTYWIFFGVSLICGIAVIINYFKENIKEHYYKIRWPEKLIKVIIHYPGNLYKIYWRLIPDRDDFTIDGKSYAYGDQAVLKENDFYVRRDDNKLIVMIDGKAYFLDDEYNIRRKGNSWPEIHYPFNVPYPINFNLIDKSEIKFSAVDMQDFKNNHLFEELLTLEGKKNLMIFILLICGLNFLVTAFLLAKTMGWLK